LVLTLMPMLSLWHVLAGESTSIVINEIAYRGTAAASTDEWIELYNASSDTIDLNGWQLFINTNNIHLSGSIPAYSYFLLERSDDRTILDQGADQIFTLSLSDSGAVLQLKNSSGTTVDQVSSWHVDLSSPPVGFSNRSSMERISPYLSGDLALNWRINNQQVRHGLDANGGQIFGTPRFHNSQTIHAFGYGYESIGALPVPQVPTAEQILMNELEILPPSGQKEWIELWNSTDSWFDLGSCGIHDSTALIFPFTASSSLLPGEMMAYDFSSAKLGDNGDSVELRCGEEVIDRIEYGNQSTGTPYTSSEGYSEDLHYLPSPNGFNTLGRSPNGNSLWFLMSHADYPTKGLPNLDLRAVPGVSNASFISGPNSVRLSWTNPDDVSVSGTRIYLKYSGTNDFLLHNTLGLEEQTAFISNLPNEAVEFRIASFNDTGKEAEGLDVAHLMVNLLGVTISEVLPYPKTGFEFIEFHNASTTPINLTGYELSITNTSADLNDPSGTFEFSDFTLAPGEYFAFFIDPEVHSFRLSNQQALITLSDPDGMPVSEVEYLFPSRGVSIAYDDQLETTLFHPTPNAENIFQNAAPQAVLTVQGTGAVLGCTVLNFNPTGANSYDPDDDELFYRWVYRTMDGDILFASSEENPLSFKFTQEMGEFFSALLTVSDPFGASSSVTIPLELQFCNGGKRITSSPSTIINQQPSTIFINEVFPNPSGSDMGVEFIELYNFGTENISLDGWRLGGKTKKKLDGAQIKPQGYLSFTEATLLNSANTIQLLDPFSNTISEVTYPDPEEGQSYSRDDQGTFRWTIPTPGKKNDFPFKKETVYLQGTAPVIIHRILPNPSGTDEDNEWIELKNRSANEVNLSGWKIDNREGGSLPFTITGNLFLRSQQVHRFISRQTGITLRNTADQVRLFDANGVLVDQLEWKSEVGSGVILAREDLSLANTIEPDQATVIKVIDGDTIDVRLDGKIESVRLIGVDTPETVHPFKPIEEYGKEASNYTKSRLQGKNVRLEYDLSKRDKYGRILAYIYVDDAHFNAELIEKGYAFAYLRFPFKYREEFRLLELKAREAGVGMWSHGEVQQIQKEQKAFVDEELEAMEILEEILEELEREEEIKPEEEVIEYDQTGWEYIKLNEVLSNPKGKDEGLEYIELMNQGNSDVSLLNWKIINNKNKVLYQFKDLQTLLPLQVLLLPDLLTTLKNENETIQLMDPLGTVRDELAYSQPIKDDWVWSRNPLTTSWQLVRSGTPGGPNEIILIADPDTDRDGISDDDELLLQLNSNNWDSDGNGYPDDFELLFKDSPVVEWPEQYHNYLTESFTIEMKQTARTLTFFGESRPYTTIQLTLHSTPQTVSIPVKQNGTWTYKVDLGLEKGEHHAEALAMDPVGNKGKLSEKIPFVLNTRMNVSKLPKAKKAVSKKASKVKLLYQVIDQPIHFFDGEIAAWDADKGLLTLNDGRILQLPSSRRELGNVFLRLGERIRYSLENDQITVKKIELIPSSFASYENSKTNRNEPLFLLFIFSVALSACFFVGRSKRMNE